jgi:DegV family protein with EDD domain
MPRIAVITDTDASLPVDVATRHGIILVPILVAFGDLQLRSGIDIGDADVFARVDREGRLPTTAAPSPGDFQRAYDAAFAAGADAIVCICVSSVISGTYNAALVAANTLDEGPHRGKPIRVVDSRTLSMAQGFMALAAADAASAGASLDQVVAQAESVGSRSLLYACLSTLRYLAMSGRVGHLAAGMASVLNIKPVLTVRDGKLDMLEKVRTQRRAWERVIELTMASLGGACPERLAILHVAVPTQAAAFAAQLRASMPCPQEILTVELGAGLSVHSGAGMLGVAAVRPG